MQPEILLAQLRALIARAPDLRAFSPTSAEHQVWLGQAHALISRWDAVEAVSFKSHCGFLSSRVTKLMGISGIISTLHRAIADLELKVPLEIEVSFGVGEVYNFFLALNRVIKSAEKSIFIIDPYLDYTVVEHYLTSRADNVSVRLLLNHNTEKIITAVGKYNSQHGTVVELRISKTLHDRVIFIDDYVCWLIGQSIKNAAKAKPTYLVPLPPDVVPNKLSHYEGIWSSAQKLEL